MKRSGTHLHRAPVIDVAGVLSSGARRRRDVVAARGGCDQVLSAVLRWDADAPGFVDRVWHLPDNVVLKGAAPLRFGITVERHGPNSFRVRVLWNHLSLIWERLSRTQIMASSLATILDAVGTELWYLLEQPVVELQAA